MDKLLYISASGASQDLLGTGIRANNLANAQTTGFRAQLEQARSMPAYGEGLPTRVFSMTESPSNNYESGPMIKTDRDLDVAIQGDGWFAVQDQNGQEAYSRDGNFKLGDDGILTDIHDRVVLGDNGPIFLPVPLDNLNIAADGTLSMRQLGAPANVIEEVGRRLVREGHQIQSCFVQRDRMYVNRHHYPLTAPCDCGVFLDLCILLPRCSDGIA